MSGIAFPPLHKSAVDACLYSSWFSAFKKITPKATILDLPGSFIEYLESDGLFVPKGSGHAHEELEDSWDNDSDDEDSLKRDYAFPELDARVREIISLYGSVFPKLSWSSPQVSFVLLGRMYG